MREPTVAGLTIRPARPVQYVGDNYRVGDSIEELYDDSWCMGWVEKVRPRRRYAMFIPGLAVLVTMAHDDLRASD